MKYIEELPNFNEDNFIEKYLELKGVAKEDHELFLRPAGNLLVDDLSISEDKQIKNTLEKIKYCIENNKKIGLAMHVDLDSFFSNLVMYKFLSNFKNLPVYISFPKVKRQGINDNVFNEFIQEKVELAIMLDACSNDEEEIGRFLDLGIETVVIDHHPPSETMKKYKYIINNHMGNFKNVDGSGCLLTWKVVKTLSEEFGIELDKTMMEYTAISLLADVMNINNLENRYIIKTAFENITDPVIQEMINKMGNCKNEFVIPFEWGWNINPSLNGLVKLGNVEYTEKLFLAFLNPYDDCSWTTANKRVMHGSRLDCALYLIRNKGKEKKKIIDNLLPEFAKEIGEVDKVICLFTDGRISPFLSGDLAGKVANTYLKPAISLIETKAKDVEYLSGSCRSPIDIRSKFVESGLFEYALGHEKAFGFSFKKENMDKIQQFFDNLDLQTESVENVIRSYPPEKFPTKLFFEVEKYRDIFGKGIEVPKFHCQITIEQDEIFQGKRNLFKWYKHGIEFLKFFSTLKLKEQLIEKKYQNVTLDLIGRLEINYYNGNEKPQFIIDTIEVIEYDKEEIIDIMDLF